MKPPQCVKDTKEIKCSSDVDNLVGGLRLVPGRGLSDALGGRQTHRRPGVGTARLICPYTTHTDIHITANSMNKIHEITYTYVLCSFVLGHITRYAKLN